MERTISVTTGRQMIDFPRLDGRSFIPSADFAAGSLAELGPNDTVHEIAWSVDGRGVRTILSGRKIIESRSMPLLKAGGAFHTEASIEPRFAKHLAFDTSVIRMVSQPCWTSGALNGGRWSYLPDAAVGLIDGTWTFKEFKADHRYRREPDRVHKMALSAEAFAAAGRGFDLLTPEALGSTIVDDNINLMMVSQFTRVDDRHKSIAAASLRAAGVISLRELWQAFGGHPAEARSVAYAMMAQRLIDIDLLRPLGPHSVVRSAPPVTAQLPPLRF